MDKPPYWKPKHVARTNYEVVRTYLAVVQVLLTLLVVVKVFGWL